MDNSTIKKIKDVLKTKTLEATGRKASGCINQGEAFRTDSGLVFIKSSNAPVVRSFKYGNEIHACVAQLVGLSDSYLYYFFSQAKVLFESEFTSLRTIEQTGTVRVPHPIAIVEGSDNTFYCILEFLDLRNTAAYQKELGEKLADLHLHNEQVAKKDGPIPYVRQFGFPETTCIGLLPLDNTWHDDWPVIFLDSNEKVRLYLNDILFPIMFYRHFIQKDFKFQSI